MYSPHTPIGAPYLLELVCPRGPFPPALSRSPPPRGFPLPHATLLRRPAACPVARGRCRDGTNAIACGTRAARPDILGIIAPSGIVALAEMPHQLWMYRETRGWCVSAAVDCFLYFWRFRFFVSFLIFFIAFDFYIEKETEIYRKPTQIRVEALSTPTDNERPSTSLPSPPLSLSLAGHFSIRDICARRG